VPDARCRQIGKLYTWAHQISAFKTTVWLKRVAFGECHTLDQPIVVTLLMSTTWRDGIVWSWLALITVQWIRLRTRLQESRAVAKKTRDTSCYLYPTAEISLRS